MNFYIRMRDGERLDETDGYRPLVFETTLWPIVPRVGDIIELGRGVMKVIEVWMDGNHTGPKPMIIDVVLVRDASVDMAALRAAAKALAACIEKANHCGLGQEIPVILAKAGL